MAAQKVTCWSKVGQMQAIECFKIIACKFLYELLLYLLAALLKLQSHLGTIQQTLAYKLAHIFGKAPLIFGDNTGCKGQGQSADFLGFVRAKNHFKGKPIGTIAREPIGRRRQQPASVAILHFGQSIKQSSGHPTQQRSKYIDGCYLAPHEALYHIPDLLRGQGL